MQELFPPRLLYSARTDVAGAARLSAARSIKMLPVDYDYIEAESPRIKKRFNEIFQ